MAVFFKKLMKTARYCLELVNLGGLLRLGEHLGKANSKMIANNILAKVFGRKPLSHEKCNIFNYRFKSIVQKTRYLAQNKKILESSPSLRVIGLKCSFSYNFYQCQNRMLFACILQPFVYLFPRLTHTDKTLLTLHKL